MIVLDASVAVLAFGHQERSQQAREALDQTDWRCPGIFLGECGNTLARMVRTRTMTLSVAEDAFELVSRLAQDRIVVADVVPAAFKTALALNHPVFDCIYLETARAIGGRVVTIDARFANKIGASANASLVIHLADWRP